MTRLPVTEWCDALGMTQAALAEQAGLTESVVSDYVAGRRNPTLKTISALAKAVNRAPWEFLRGPLPGEGLPTADEARADNIEWFSKLTPSQKARAAETSRKLALRAAGFARELRGRRARR
jgi:transcriptional regulator with XRE-family HTH domain